MKCLRDSHDFFAPKYWAPFVLIGDDVKIELEKESFEQVVSGKFPFFLAVLVTEGLRRKVRIILVKFR